MVNFQIVGEHLFELMNKKGHQNFLAGKMNFFLKISVTGSTTPQISNQIDATAFRQSAERGRNVSILIFRAALSKLWPRRGRQLSD